MAFHYTQNIKQMSLSGIRSSKWSGFIDMTVNWFYTIFTLAHSSLLKILTFTSTSGGGAFASTCNLLLSDLCHDGSFLTFRPLVRVNFSNISTTPLLSKIHHSLFLSPYPALFPFIAHTAAFILCCLFNCLFTSLYQNVSPTGKRLCLCCLLYQSKFN